MSVASPPAPPPTIDPPATTTRRRRGRKPGGSRFPAAPWVLLPSIILTFIFVYGFIAFSGWISVSQWNRPTRQDLDLRQPFGATYGELFAEQRFQADLRNVVVFTIGFLILALLGGLLLALLVHHVTVGRGLFRSVFLLPYALSFIVTGVAFRWIFNPDQGINVVLHSIGVSNPPRWTTDPTILAGINTPGDTLKIVLGVPVALIPIIVAAAWQLMGFAMAMYLAGLAGIPDEQLEAASVDGAGTWQRLRHVVIPQLWPVTVTCFVILLHVSLKIFDLVVAMSGSGPAFVTDVPGIYVFDMMTKGGRYDKGTAAALVLLVLACLVIVPYLARSYRRERS
jgi:glucose/mannose transport system permease protein